MTAAATALDSNGRPTSKGAHGPPIRSSPCAAIAQIAAEQFRRWRPGDGSALRETSPAASPTLREYYRVGVGAHVTDAQMQSPSFQAGHPWSAVFVSYVMRIAGAGPAFAYSALHQTYIRAARSNRLRRNIANPFWAFRVTEVAPRVGDLVCAARRASGATYDNIGDPQRRATHCDVVTDVQPGRVRVVGGNVRQTVGEKWLHTLPDGRLSIVGAQSPLFAVITCRPVDGADSSAAATAAPAGEHARVLRVMHLLVHRYGFPVNGAAGIVGNLVAESGVLPNRIEGSRTATPMRAPGLQRPGPRLHARRGSRPELRRSHRPPPPRDRHRPVDLARPPCRALPARLRRAPAGLGDPVGPRRPGRLPGLRAAPRLHPRLPDADGSRRHRRAGVGRRAAPVRAPGLRAQPAAERPGRPAGHPSSTRACSRRAAGLPRDDSSMKGVRVRRRFRFEIVRRDSGRFSWVFVRLDDRGRRVLASSERSYRSKKRVRRAIAALDGAPIVDATAAYLPILLPATSFRFMRDAVPIIIDESPEEHDPPDEVRGETVQPDDRKAAAAAQVAPAAAQKARATAPKTPAAAQKSPATDAPEPATGQTAEAAEQEASATAHTAQVAEAAPPATAQTAQVQGAAQRRRPSAPKKTG